MHDLPSWRVHDARIRTRTSGLSGLGLLVHAPWKLVPVIPGFAARGMLSDTTGAARLSGSLAQEGVEQGTEGERADASWAEFGVCEVGDDQPGLGGGGCWELEENEIARWANLPEIHPDPGAVFGELTDVLAPTEVGHKG